MIPHPLVTPEAYATLAEKEQAKLDEPAWCQAMAEAIVTMPRRHRHALMRLADWAHALLPSADHAEAREDTLKAMEEVLAPICFSPSYHVPEVPEVPDSPAKEDLAHSQDSVGEATPDRKKKKSRFPFRGSKDEVLAPHGACIFPQPEGEPLVATFRVLVTQTPQVRSCLEPLVKATNGRIDSRYDSIGSSK